MSAVMEILHLVEGVEELRTEVQGIITSPCLATTLMYDVLSQWSLYLNRCVDLSVLESLETRGEWSPSIWSPSSSNWRVGATSAPFFHWGLWIFSRTEKLATEEVSAARGGWSGAKAGASGGRGGGKDAGSL